MNYAEIEFAGYNYISKNKGGVCMDIKDFKNPDAKFRPVPFWSWNEKLEKEEVKRQIHEMAGKGWGGYFCHSRPGLVTGYLSKEWMEIIKLCAEEARASNTYSWLYDEDKWPSGYASGMLAKEEKHRDRCIMLVKKEDIKPEDKILKEVVYNSEEYAVCMHILPLGDEWFNGTTYVDLMNPDTVKAFLESTHEKYKEVAGEYFGKEIPGIFTDEPCYFMRNYYAGNKFKSMRALPWSDGLPAYFEKLKGYSLIEHIEELFLNINDYRKTRFDFYDTATKLFVESFTKQYGDWCEKNNLKFTGHFMGEDSLQLQTEWIGAAMPHYEYMQYPGIDKLSRNINEIVTVKQLTSVADQLGKERALCESFGCMGQHTSFFHRKWIGDWLQVLGVNFINHHLSLYSMRGERKRDYPANFFYQQPWWECEKPFADYLARISYALTQGKRDIDILVIHPIASAWSEYTPLKELKEHLNVIRDINSEFVALSKGLAANKLDFHYGDEIIMENHAHVENGRLIVGNHSYSTVIVPSTITIRENTLKLLDEFMKASVDNTLILINPAPKRLEGAERDIQWPERTQTADSYEDAICILDRKYQERISIINKEDGKNAEKILVHERTAEDGKLIFLANTDEINKIDALISVKAECKPLALDIASGELFSIPCSSADGRIMIDVCFRPAGSLLLIFPAKNMHAENAPVYLDSGVEFKTCYEIIKTVKSTEFTINESNILRLDNITLWMDGQKVLENEHIAKAWYDIFYVAKDGTPFTAEYAFDVVNIPEGELFAVIEMAENLDSIKLNGFEIKPMKKRGEPIHFKPEANWKDISFTKVPFSASLLKEGKNILVIQGKKVNNITGISTHRHVQDFNNYNPTEIETIYIVGNFMVGDVDRKSFYMDGKIKTADSQDITSTGYPFYAGSITLDYIFDLDDGDKASVIMLNDINAACVEVYVNGKPLGVKYWEPYIFNVSNLLNTGSNKITVKAYTTLFNLIGPNHIEDILQRQGVGPYTFVDFKKYTESYVLLPFGLGSIDIMK